MDKREQMIRLWFSMWLEKKDLGMDDIFAEGECNRLGYQTVFS